MASGHVNRIKRPDTWLHRPMLQNVKKVLANPEPSTHGRYRLLMQSRSQPISPSGLCERDSRVIISRALEQVVGIMIALDEALADP